MALFTATPAPEVDDVAELAADGLSQLGPQVLVVGAAGIGVLVLFVVYRMVSTAIRSKGSRVG